MDTTLLMVTRTEQGVNSINVPKHFIDLIQLTLSRSPPANIRNMFQEQTCNT